MKLTKVRVLESRSSLGVPGDILRVTDERLDLLLKSGLVEKVEEKITKQITERPKGRRNQGGIDERTDT